MQVIEISGPQFVTFETNPARPLLIYKKGGAVYHIQRSKNNFTGVKFPKSGVYSSKCKIIDVKENLPSSYLPDLPRKDRNYDPEKFHIVYNPNLAQTPARIYYEIGRCEVGPSFYAYPIQWQKFILLHEKGHLFYSGEHEADLYAVKEFMKAGYNYSQAYYAMSQVLKNSTENISRIEKILNILTNEN